MVRSAPRPKAACLRLVLALSLALTTAPGQTRPYADPHPPKVHDLKPQPRPEAQSYPGLVYRGPAKALAKDAVTRDWPRFLGPRRDSHCDETRLLKEFPKGGPKLVWAMPRGDGYACPVVLDGRVVYTHRVGDTAHVDCLDAATGKRYWRRSAPCDYSGKYITNGGPRATPELKAGRVYIHGVQGELRCLELDTGRTIWERDLAKELGTVDDFFGVCSSPLLVGDLLIQNLSAPRGPTVAAFRKDTGRIAWIAGTKWAASCASPVLGRIHGKDRVFVLAGGESRPPVGGLLVLDPANGAVDVRQPFRSKLFASVCGACPVVGDDWVFLTSAYGLGSTLLKLDSAGGHEVAWKNRRLGMQFSNPVLHEGAIYAIDGRSDRAGAIVCIDPKDGKTRSRTDLNWEEKFVHQGRERTLSVSVGEGSLLHADGDFLCLGDNGHLLWLRCTPEGTKILSRAWLFRANESWTPLALSRGLLYVCQNNPEHLGDAPPRLLCYDLRAGS